MSDKGFDLKFDDRGLIPAIAQDADTGEVLMMAWMNAEALQRTIESGEAYFWSRSRKELWHKGATSGNFLRVVRIDVDCDSDALLLRVHPTGPACHTGRRSCFFNEIPQAPEGIDRPKEPERSFQIDGTNLVGDLGPAHFDLSRLYAVICDRRDHPSPDSYTSRLLNLGEDEMVKKIGEEAVEVILATKSQGQERLIEEIADLAYHTLVLLSARRLEPQAVLAELERRHKHRSTPENG